MNTQEVLQQCTVEGTIVKLPNIQLERKLYQDVAKSLELIGGKWKGGKIFGFVFPSDPTELLEQIASGEKKNIKKEYQFFGTPSELAARMVDLADIQQFDLILEPSAGQGAISDEIIKVMGCDNALCLAEKMPVNRTILNDKYKNRRVDVCLLNLEENDFLLIDKYNKKIVFDKIIANPPFSKNQDIDHIRKMYSVLANKGRIVTLSSTHWEHSSNKKETEFRAWLMGIRAEVTDIPASTFKESGTNIATKLIIINK